MIPAPGWLVLVVLSAIAVIFAGITLTALWTLPGKRQRSKPTRWPMIAIGSVVGAITLPAICLIISANVRGTSDPAAHAIGRVVMGFLTIAAIGAIGGGVLGLLTFVVKRYP